MKLNPAIQQTERRRISVRGRVQGVGFRPTVYRYACELGLTGSVRNDSTGVVIEVQGPPAKLDTFIARLRESPPPQARIAELKSQPIPAAGAEKAFEIAVSTRSGHLDAGMPPDLATCNACRREMQDTQDRRYGYAFLNCTNCGPRFTIIRSLPYDREKTSMAAFDMCPECRREYTDPRDRRFDAQPNACPECGPQLTLSTAAGECIPGDPVEEAARLLESGAILAVKGLGGYHLCCLATGDAPVAELRKRKKRPAKALAVMFASLDQALEYCKLTEADEAELLAAGRPIVIVQQRPGNELSAMISPDTGDVGAFLPYTPLHHLLLAKVSPLVMTSANFSEEPIASCKDELRRLVGTVADHVLDHDREIVRRCDDSVLKMNQSRRLMIRRSRGFVPNPVRLPHSGPGVFACGADMKNTFCVASGHSAYLSQHIGDLEELAASEFYKEAARDLIELLQVNVEAVAHDMHPGYQSTAYAANGACAVKIPVQHHHAHIASCLADNGAGEKVIGVALDGTGYGPDDTIWGGEFLVADIRDYERVGHFRQYRMPGGEAATRNPDRMALSVLRAEGIDVAVEHCVSPLAHIAHEQRKLLDQILDRGINAPLTSSAGRLFDAVSALLGLCHSADYEGQAPMRLQAVADPRVQCAYNYEIDDRGVVSFGPAVCDILDDIEHDVAPSRIAGMFHRTVAAAVVEMCSRVRASRGIQTAALSGGVFQNDLLLNLVTDGLKTRGFRVLQHRQVPPNDAGISLGQAAVARARLARQGATV